MPQKLTRETEVRSPRPRREDTRKLTAKKAVRPPTWTRKRGSAERQLEEAQETSYWGLNQPHRKQNEKTDRTQTQRRSYCKKKRDTTREPKKRNLYNALPRVRTNAPTPERDRGTHLWRCGTNSSNRFPTSSAKPRPKVVTSSPKARGRR